MKTILTLSILFLFTAITAKAESFKVFPEPGDQSVTMTTLGEAQKGDELEKQLVFEKFIKAALADIKIPDVSIEIVFYNGDKTDSHKASTYIMPNPFKSKVKKYMVKITRETMKEHEDVLEHIAYHEISHIKNGDIGGYTMAGIAMNNDDVPEEERERRAEYTSYKAMGWEKYKKYWLIEYDKKESLRSSITEARYLQAIQEWLGVWKEPAASVKR